MAYFSVHAFFLCFRLYISYCAHFLLHLLIQHSHSSGKFLLHLGLFHPTIYPHRPPETEICVTVFLGGLWATLNYSISISPASMRYVLVLVSAINGLQVTFNDRISTAPSSMCDGLVLVSAIYIPGSITSS